jgi:TPR repeat protein
MTDAPGLAALNAMSADALAARLAGAPEERVAVIRTAAEGGVAEAQLVIGQMLLDGKDVPADPNQAFSWFNRAAKQHHILALNMVGRCYELGWGTPIDMTRAAECFRIAAEQGLPEGMYNYATRLTLGEGVGQDRAAALEWFRKASASGRSLIAAKSENYIGSFHEDGWVVERDREAASRHYRLAAEGGDFRGQFNLARLLAEEGDIDLALVWLARVGESATPAFVEKAAAWLRGSSDSRLRDDGLAALRSGRAR